MSAWDWRLLLLLLLLLGHDWDLAPAPPPLLPAMRHVWSATAAAAATWSC
jgi:hypothetical protein